MVDTSVGVRQRQPISSAPKLADTDCLTLVPSIAPGTLSRFRWGPSHRRLLAAEPAEATLADLRYNCPLTVPSSGEFPVRCRAGSGTVPSVNSSFVPLLDHGDAFGRVLSDCWEAGARPGVVFEIVERDDGYIQANDAAGYFAERDDWSPVERWGSDQASGRVLDVGCGAGRHAVVLRAAGHDVVGVDPSPGAVTVARARGVPVVAGTIRDLSDDTGPFDTIILMGNNLGLIGPGDSGDRFLCELASLAAPGAQLIGSGLDPYHTHAPEHLACHERNRRHGRLSGHVRIRVRDRCVATPWFDYVHRSPDELATAVAKTPWAVRDVERDGANYCAVLRRPAG